MRTRRSGVRTPRGATTTTEEEEEEEEEEEGDSGGEGGRETRAAFVRQRGALRSRARGQNLRRALPPPYYSRY